MVASRKVRLDSPKLGLISPVVNAAERPAVSPTAELAELAQRRTGSCRPAGGVRRCRTGDTASLRLALAIRRRLPIQFRYLIGMDAEELARDKQRKRWVHDLWARLYDASGVNLVRATIPILAAKDDRIVPVGTGVLLKIGTKHFVLTAAHVLDLNIEHHFLFALAPVKKGDLPIPLAGEVVLWRSDFPEGVDPKASDARDDDKFDVGFIELSQEIVDQLGSPRRFASLGEIDVSATLHQGCYAFAGYPYKISTVDLETRSLSVNLMHYLTELRDPPVDETNLRLVLKFRKQNTDQHGNEVEAPDPSGISGCGIWRLSIIQPFDRWTTDQVKLVAIQHSWSKSDSVVYASPIRFLMQAIYRRYPDIRKIMDLHLGQETVGW